MTLSDPVFRCDVVACHHVVRRAHAMWHACMMGMHMAWTPVRRLAWPPGQSHGTGFDRALHHTATLRCTLSMHSSFALESETLLTWHQWAGDPKLEGIMPCSLALKSPRIVLLAYDSY